MLSGYISPAAANTGSGLSSFDFLSFLPLLLVFVIFYFFLIRPQQKKAQQQEAILAGLKRGDRVVTSGGIIGNITKVLSSHELQIEIAEAVRVRVMRSSVTQVLSKSTETHVPSVPLEDGEQESEDILLAEDSATGERVARRSKKNMIAKK